jgi:hypothetical protein
VWYSAAWSRATLEAFQAALATLLATRKHELQAEVLHFLQHWQQHGEVPLASSRKQWLDSMTETYSTQIADFKEKKDRMAMCSYVLTGQLLEGEVGSSVMFSLPAGKGERALNEMVLQVGYWAESQSALLLSH